MKEKILIIGRPGTGKTSLGKLMADLMGYNLVDEAPSALWLSLNAEPRTVYVSNSITGAEATLYLNDFTVIAVSNL
jgi:replication-associated recombination protein RarA